MTILRRNTLKKICKYQYGISGSVKHQFIDLFNELTVEILGKSIKYINLNEVFKSNIDFFNTEFMPMLDFLLKK